MQDKGKNRKILCYTLSPFSELMHLFFYGFHLDGLFNV